MKRLFSSISPTHSLARRFLVAFSLCAGLLNSLPAQAAIQRSADFNQGSTLGIGLYGLSYDYGVGWFSAGVVAASQASASLSSPLNASLNLSTRLLGRVYEKEGLSAGVIAGLQFDPGYAGGRAYLTPDLGFSMAYDFRQFDIPLALRLNLTVAVSERNQPSYYSPDDPQPRPNFFQQLSFGPQTSLELAWLANENLEVTLGGGSLAGMRLKF